MKSFKNKTLATLLAAVGGTLGLHRFYLHGTGDRRGYAYPAVTLAGMLGALFGVLGLLIVALEH